LADWALRVSTNVFEKWADGKLRASLRLVLAGNWLLIMEMKHDGVIREDSVWLRELWKPIVLISWASSALLAGL
jgi:hypothetical protein